MNADGKTTLIIADDHPIVRQGLRQIIDREADFDVLLECGDGPSVLIEAKLRQPDVVILDIDMPGMNGLEVLKALQGANFPGKAILLTVHAEEEFFDEAVRLGAQGYVLKDSAVEDVVSAIRSVVRGQNYTSPALTSMLFKNKSRSLHSRSGLENLTPTERQVLKMIAEYQTNKQIAETLFISPLTVKTHRRNICNKLDLEGNHALMKFAIENKSIL